MSDVAESRQERKERTRQAILDAALELSEETGLGGLSLRAIAKRVGIVPTAFYRHFDSIEQLGLALVDTSFASLRQMMRQARREWTDIDAVITQSVSILARNVHERPEYFTFMFRERMSGIESVRAAIRHELELLERELATDLARLRPGGLVQRGPAGASNLIVGMMVNTTEAILTAPRPEVEKAVLHTAEQIRLTIIGAANWRSRPGLTPTEPPACPRTQVLKPAIRRGRVTTLPFRRRRVPGSAAIPPPPAPGVPVPPRTSRRTMSGLAGAAVLGLLASPLSAVTADAAPSASGDLRSTQGLRNGVTVAGITEHLAALQAISDANGGNRVSGFGGYDASKDYAVERLEAAGYDVTVQPFEFPYDADRTPAVLQQVSPDPQRLGRRRRLLVDDLQRQRRRDRRGHRRRPRRPVPGRRERQHQRLRGHRLRRLPGRHHRPDAARHLSLRPEGAERRRPPARSAR